MLFKATLGKELHAHLDQLANPMASVDWTDDVRLPALEKLGVVDGLSPKQQEQLVSLIVALWKVEQVVPWTYKHRAKRARWSKDGAGYVREIARLALAAEMALGALALYLKKHQVGKRTRGILGPATGALDQHAIREVEERLEGGLGYLGGRSRVRVMRILFRFFKTTCGLYRAEAEVRVGRIGNEYWDWNVKVVEQVQRRAVGPNRILADDTRRGCEAVRKAVTRRKRPRGHS